MEKTAIVARKFSAVKSLFAFANFVGFLQVNPASAIKSSGCHYCNEMSNLVTFKDKSIMPQMLRGNFRIIKLVNYILERPGYHAVSFGLSLKDIKKSKEMLNKVIEESTNEEDKKWANNFLDWIDKEYVLK